MPTRESSTSSMTHIVKGKAIPNVVHRHTYHSIGKENDIWADWLPSQDAAVLEKTLPSDEVRHHPKPDDSSRPKSADALKMPSSCRVEPIERPRTCKRVSFKEESDLVQVQHIPGRNPVKKIELCNASASPFTNCGYHYFPISRSKPANLEVPSLTPIVCASVLNALRPMTRFADMRIRSPTQRRVERSGSATSTCKTDNSLSPPKKSEVAAVEKPEKVPTADSPLCRQRAPNVGTLRAVSARPLNCRLLVRAVQVSSPTLIRKMRSPTKPQTNLDGNVLVDEQTSASEMSRSMKSRFQLISLPRLQFQEQLSRLESSAEREHRPVARGWLESPVQREDRPMARGRLASPVRSRGSPRPGTFTQYSTCTYVDNCVPREVSS